ncbi:MAG: rhamnogalacturonan acetylesterase [Pseudomonadota bacterium]
MIGFLAAFLLQAAAIAPPPADPPVVRIKPSKIILVGDSTTQVNSGWGGSFCATRVTSFAACVNLGRGGRSTKSYRAEGSWDLALAEMKTPGYVTTWVLIQFGHNDQPGKPGRSTDLVSEFPANLKRYVEDVRAAGAKPILVTPLTRRFFKDGQITRDLDPWADAVRKVAREMNVPLIDLNARSAAIIQAMGPAMAGHYSLGLPDATMMASALGGNSGEKPVGTPAPPQPAPAPLPDGLPRVGVRGDGFDYTHLNRDGADLFAGVVAIELAKVLPEMRPILIP